MTTPLDGSSDSSLERGRAASARHAWREAYDSLSAADLEHLAEAAFWIARHDDCIRGREDGDYHGKGGNQAARIGALAQGGEILASETTLAAAAGSFATLEPVTVTLKGMSEQVTVVGIAW